MEDTNFYTVQGWMVNKLDLKGHELTAYAIIYGFSQEENTKFTGSLLQFTKWMQVSKTTVITTLKNLIAKGIISKEQYTINKVTFNKYKTII